LEIGIRNPRVVGRFFLNNILQSSIRKINDSLRTVSRGRMQTSSVIRLTFNSRTKIMRKVTLNTFYGPRRTKQRDSAGQRKASKDG